MFAVCAITVLCLVALSRSAPLACEDLLRPLDQLDLHSLEGRRALIAGSVSHQPLMETFSRRDSASASFSGSTGVANMSLTRSMHLENECYYSSYNVSLEGSSFSYDNVTATFIRTSCRDCVLLSFDVESGKRLHFYLFSQRRELEQEEMQEFRAQVECLNMPPPVVMDPTKELCPEQGSSDSATQTDEKTQGEKN